MKAFCIFEVILLNMLRSYDSWFNSTWKSDIQFNFCVRLGVVHKWHRVIWNNVLPPSPIIAKLLSSQNIWPPLTIRPWHNLWITPYLNNYFTLLAEEDQWTFFYLLHHILRQYFHEPKIIRNPVFETTHIFAYLLDTYLWNFLSYTFMSCQ